MVMFGLTRLQVVTVSMIGPVQIFVNIDPLYPVQIVKDSKRDQLRHQQQLESTLPVHYRVLFRQSWGID